MACVAIMILMVSAMLLCPVNGKETQDKPSNKGLNEHNLVRRNSQTPGTFRDWQWYLRNTAISMNVESAWEAGYTGKGVLVAVVDDGVNMNHPDLVSNFDATSSYDFFKGRNISRYYSPGSHGTNCAGIIAGGNNNNCGVGIAFDAQTASVRIYDDHTRSTDQSEARALSHKRNLIDIYSNSWGPGDMGWQVEGPGPLLTEVLEQGTRMGRHRKGSIFVFAAGNGGIVGDSCAFSGYVNSIHTIAISSVNWDGSLPSFSEQCAAIMAVTYGQDLLTFTNGKARAPMITTEGQNQCTEEFSGTSASTAMASGIIALALQANPYLTWRDVQHLIARSSKPLAPQLLTRRSFRRPTPIWITNAANLSASSHYGFGLMDANKMIQYAKNWTSAPEQLTCEAYLKISSSNPSQIPWNEAKLLSLEISEGSCDIRYLEHVQVQVDLSFPRRGYLEMSFVSPSGTRSRLLYPRVIDSLTGLKNFTNWKVTSLHQWGENPIGKWNIIIRNTRKNRKTRQVEGDYSEWSSWSQCSATCGNGTQQRNRSCNNPPHVNMSNKTSCVNLTHETRTCTSRICPMPVDGNYSEWSSWSQCSVTCGNGTQQRNRSCNNPPQVNVYNKTLCVNLTHETRTCTSRICPVSVDGNYSEWSFWSQCSVTCGNGTQQRNRSCTNPPPAYNGTTCLEIAKETRACASKICPTQGIPVDGRYSQWTWWSWCSVSCGGGSQTRLRLCNNPPPQNGGKECSRFGKSTETRGCNTQGCPVHGRYSKWTAWRKCSKSCDGGIQRRSRSCTNPPPANRGRRCWGPANQWRRCNTHKCPGHLYSLKLILYGTKEDPLANNPHVDRRRKKVAYFTKAQIDKRKRDIPIHGGYSQWTSWWYSKCSKTCGEGFKQRTRKCNQPSPANYGRDCSRLGPAKETRRCNMRRCPVNGGYSQWNDWSLCTKTCGDGYQHRYRSCTNPRPAYGGQNCGRLGRAYESRRCNTHKCGVYSSCQNVESDDYCISWRWSCRNSEYLQRNCPKTCGKCRVDGAYSGWSRWSKCSVTCGDGTQQRHRSCNNPPPANNGAPCRGPTREIQACSYQMCPEAYYTREICRDKQSKKTCDYWKIYCKTSADARRICAKTCRQCEVCKNAWGDSYCGKYRSHCNINLAFTQQCKKTCNLC